MAGHRKSCIIPFPMAGGRGGTTARRKLPKISAGGDTPAAEGDDDGWPRQTLAGARVLVLEHETESLDALVSALEQWGARVFAFTSPVEAEYELAAIAPDALIVAIRIPGDPYRLIATLRRHDAARQRHTPVLAVIGSTLDRRRAAAAGIHLCVRRPPDRARLRLALSNLVTAAA
jgi:CheY-like chemotaxis protein